VLDRLCTAEYWPVGAARLTEDAGPWAAETHGTALGWKWLLVDLKSELQALVAH